MIVELAGDAPGPNRRVHDRHSDGLLHIEGVSFPLPEGLPAGSWLLLRRGSEWIDRRFLSVPWGRGREAGVEVVVEAATRLESLVSAGERQLVEFKRQIPKEDETKAKIMKTVCAFANGQGGSLLIGVDDE